MTKGCRASGADVGRTNIELVHVPARRGPYWVAGPVTGLGEDCGLSARVPVQTREVRLGDTPRPDPRQLAGLCADGPVRAEIELLNQVVARVRAARRALQQHFPYGFGPVLGDLMPAGDGGEDLLRAAAEMLGEVFAEQSEHLPPRARACPWGAFDTARCGRDAFGRLVHDDCTTPTVPAFPAADRFLGRWMWRVVQVLETMSLDRFVTREVRPAPGARVEAGMLGPIILRIGGDGAAKRAGGALSPLGQLAAALAPAHGRHPDKALMTLYRHLKRSGARTWGSGFAARSAYTAALQARHTVVHRGDGPDAQLDDLTQSLLGKKPDRWRARTAGGLLNPAWDDMPRSDAAIARLLGAAVTRASTDGKPEWEREIRHRFIKALDQDDDVVPSSGARDPVGDPLLEGFDDRVEWVLRRLDPDQRSVALAYADDAEATWTQAALQAGVPTGEAARVGQQVRRRLKYLKAEYDRRRQ
ncbi:hypothetical protein [Streptomyces sp. B21-083]|uniref:hypothetical protein n=1 Tax=Streptomyces sp. B21-083 TaxID=3039410 RepID=UPI002FF337AA